MSEIQIPIINLDENEEISKGSEQKTPTQNDERSLSCSTTKKRVKRTIVRRVKRTPNPLEAVNPGTHDELDQIYAQITGQTPKADFQQFDQFLSQNQPLQEPPKPSPSSSLGLTSPILNRIQQLSRSVSPQLIKDCRKPKTVEFEEQRSLKSEKQKLHTDYNPNTSKVEFSRSATPIYNRQELIHPELYQPNRYGRKLLEIRNKDANCIAPTLETIEREETMRQRAVPD